MKKHLIWSSDTTELEKDIKENLGEFFSWKKKEELEYITDEEIFEEANWLNNSYLDDEKSNLNIKLNNDIIVIGDLGLWSGRKQGYRILGNNISEIFDITNNSDGVEFYVDSYNVRATEYHHDGINFYLFREFKDISEQQKQKFLDIIYMGKDITSAILNRYTRSIKKPIADVYWG